MPQEAGERAHGAPFAARVQALAVRVGQERVERAALEEALERVPEGERGVLNEMLGDGCGGLGGRVGLGGRWGS